MRPMRPFLTAFALTITALTAGIAVHARRAEAQEGLPKNGTLVIPIKTSTGDDAGTAAFKESKDGKELSITVKLKGLPFGDHAVHTVSYTHLDVYKRQLSHCRAFLL